MADGGAQLVGRQVELGVFEQALAELDARPSGRG